MNCNYRMLIIAVTLCSFSSCATRFTVKDVSYDEAWGASMQVVQNHHPIQTSKVTNLGISTFEKRVDQKAGIIHLATTYPPFGDRMTKLNITSRSAQEHNISIRVILHSMFYLGSSRDRDYEEKIRDQIFEYLYQ